MSSSKVQDLANFSLPLGFRGRPGWYVQLWWLVEATLFGLSPNFMYGWRSWLLRLFGAKLGKNVRIRATARITYPWKVTIGDHTWIGHDCVLYSLGEIEIGANVSISHKVYICTGTHDYTSCDFSILAEKVHIEDEVWIANDVFVGPGVTVGKGAVIGARSSVFNDMPAMMICIGTPAKPLRGRLDKPLHGRLETVTINQ